MRWYLWLLFGFVAGLVLAVATLGITGSQLWLSFKGRYLTKADAGTSTS